MKKGIGMNVLEWKEVGMLLSLKNLPCGSLRPRQLLGCYIRLLLAYYFVLLGESVDVSYSSNF